MNWRYFFFEYFKGSFINVNIVIVREDGVYEEINYDVYIIKVYVRVWIKIK